MQYRYFPKGVCSKEILVDLDGETVKKVEFEGGCNGNTKGIAKMVEGMNAKEVVEKLKGIECLGKGTSCPDQLAIALKEALESGRN